MCVRGERRKTKHTHTQNFVVVVVVVKGNKTILFHRQHRQRTRLRRLRVTKSSVKFKHVNNFWCLVIWLNTACWCCEFLFYSRIYIFLMDLKVCGKKEEERRLCEQAYEHANRKCVDKIYTLDFCYLVTWTFQAVLLFKNNSNTHTRIHSKEKRKNSPKFLEKVPFTYTEMKRKRM